MRLTPVLDAFYVLGSLWTDTASPHVCLSRPHLAAKLSTTVAFVEVNVVPIGTESVLEKQTLLVEGGRITALGPARQVKVPAGAVRIDGRGKYLMPGLADMHSHINLDNLAWLYENLAGGVTTIRPVRQTSVDDPIFQYTKTAGLLIPRFYIAPKITSREVEELGSMRPDSVAAYLAAYKAAGYHFLDLGGHVSSKSLDLASLQDTKPAIYDSILVAARRLTLPVAVHNHQPSFGKMLALGAGGGSYDHDVAFWDTLGVDIFSPPYALPMGVSPSQLRQLAATAQRAGIWINMTLDCLEGIVGLPDTIINARRQLVKILQDAGVGLLLSGDNGRNVHLELEAMVRAGLTPYQALVTGTRNPAQYFGILDSSGTATVGKRADLVLLYGNPLADIRYTREPAGVMLGGRWLDRATLDEAFQIRKRVEMSKGRRYWPSGALFQYGVHRFPRDRSTAEKQIYAQIAARIKQLEVLTDSLEEVKSLGPENDSAYVRLLQQVAKGFGALRADMPINQRYIVDPLARVWLREQARDGYRLTIVGVAATPGTLALSSSK